MKLYRYCSIKEYESFIRGEKLHNDNRHINGTGFFFFPVDMTIEEIKADFNHLIGIVSEEILMILETNQKLTPTSGRYSGKGRDNLRVWEVNIMYRDEFVIRDYSSETFKLLEAYELDMRKYNPSSYNPDVFYKIYPEEKK